MIRNRRLSVVLLSVVLVFIFGIRGISAQISEESQRQIEDIEDNMEFIPALGGWVYVEDPEILTNPGARVSIISPISSAEWSSWGGLDAEWSLYPFIGKVSLEVLPRNEAPAGTVDVAKFLPGRPTGYSYGEGTVEMGQKYTIGVRIPFTEGLKYIPTAIGELAPYGYNINLDNLGTIIFPEGGGTEHVYYPPSTTLPDGTELYLPGDRPNTSGLIFPPWPYGGLPTPPVGEQFPTGYPLAPNDMVGNPIPIIEPAIEPFINYNPPSTCTGGTVFIPASYSEFSF